MPRPISKIILGMMIVSVSLAACNSKKKAAEEPKPVDTMAPKPPAPQPPDSLNGKDTIQKKPTAQGD